MWDTSMNLKVGYLYEFVVEVGYLYEFVQVGYLYEFVVKFSNNMHQCIHFIRGEEGRNFTPFTCSIFPYFQWPSEWWPKSARVWMGTQNCA